MSKIPFFSVIIPTRNRLELFKLALDSVLAQNYHDIEIHVVNDGSTGEELSRYKKLELNYPSHVHFHYLVHRPNGHGQSYSMNYGAAQSKGKYLCFLDDDDYWVDDDHLSRAKRSINDSKDSVDLYFSNQKAYYSDGTQNTNNVWIEDVDKLMRHQQKDTHGSYTTNVVTLLRSGGFAHLNCSIYKKELYEHIVGMDEHIRYECDRDVYIRAIDAAKTILYNPLFISKHHIPDPKKADNMSTMINIYEKKIFQLRVYEKGILLSKKPEIIEFCRYGKTAELKHISEALYQEKRYSDALYYARQALGALPTLKWLLFTLAIFFKTIKN